MKAIEYLKHEMAEKLVLTKIEKRNMLNKLYRILSKPFIVLIVMIIAPILSFADRNYGYFFGLFIALFLLWKSRKK